MRNVFIFRCTCLVLWWNAIVTFLFAHLNRPMGHSVPNTDTRLLNAHFCLCPPQFLSRQAEPWPALMASGLSESCFPHVLQEETRPGDNSGISGLLGWSYVCLGFQICFTFILYITLRSFMRFWSRSWKNVRQSCQSVNYSSYIQFLGERKLFSRCPSAS